MKKLFLFGLILIGLTANSQLLQNAKFKPNGPFLGYDAKYVYGVFQIVADTIERNALESWLRYNGMYVATTSERKLYRLDSIIGVANNWTEFTSGGGTSIDTSSLSNRIDLKIPYSGAIADLSMNNHSIYNAYQVEVGNSYIRDKGGFYSNKIYYLPNKSTNDTLAMISDIPVVTGKVNYTDTAAMLSNYKSAIIALNADTSTLATRFAGKINYTDTSKFVGTKRDADTINGIKVFTGSFIHNIDTIKNNSPEIVFKHNSYNYTSKIVRDTTANSQKFINNVTYMSSSGGAATLTGSYPTIAIPSTGLVSGTSSFTVSFWFYSTSTAVQELFTYSGPTTSSNAMYVAFYNQKIFIQCLRTIAAGSGVIESNIPGSTLLPINAWHHVVYTRSSTNHTAYVDGILEISTSVADTTKFATNPYFSFDGSNFGSFAGKIDQICYWNGAITGTEVSALYNSSSGVITPPSTLTGGGSLIRWYDLDEGTGTTSYDKSGQNQNATFTNAVGWTTNGKTPLVGTTGASTYLESSNAINIGERGQIKIGDIFSGTKIQGNTLKAFLNNNYWSLFIGSNGKVLISPTNTTEGDTAKNSLDVVGNMSIGTKTTAPSNGLLVTGYLGAGQTSPTSQLHTTSLATGYVSKAANYTATVNDYTIEVTATTTITLPTAVGITGRIYTIKNTYSGSATVATTSSQTIDGSTTYSLSAQYKYVTVQSNGANWLIIANN